MKYTRLSTTSKVYLLTLLLIFGILFLNGRAYGHEGVKHTASEQRLEIMTRYLSWIGSGEYGEFESDLGKKAYADFEPFIKRVVPEDGTCLNNGTPAISPLEKIQSFFMQIVPGYQSPEDLAAQQLTACKEKIKLDYKMAKKYNRLLKYLQIEEGQPNLCIRADLGVGKSLTARGFNPTKVIKGDPKKQGITPSFPVYLCTGQDGGKKVRIVDASGTRLRLSPEDATRSALMVENLPQKESVDFLIERLGLK